MKTLHRSDIPMDFSYYRTGSKVFFDYYAKYTRTHTVHVDNGFSFMKMGKIFWTNIYSIIAEKIDREPSIRDLHDLWVRHGIIFWWPMRTVSQPKWWFRIPSFFVRYLELFHSTRSAFSLLDRPDYWNKWSPKARAHRRKIHELQKMGTLRIERCLDGYTYLDIYRKTRVPDPHKQYLLHMCEKIFSQSMDTIRIYIAYIDDVPLAGWVFIDEWVTSEYFTSFYAQESHPYHLGIALMDRWFLDSYEKWIKYCDLDHMRDSWQSLGYAWYTRFKSSIADHDVYFHDMWVKIF